MDYENFKEQFIEQLQEELYGKGVEARFDTKAVEKLNNEGYDAVTVTPTDSNIGVTLNVEAFHKAYEDGASMNEVVSRASDTVIRGFENQPTVDVASLMDYEQMKDKLVMEVVSTETNAEMLATVPHHEMEDMSVVYRFVIDSNEDGRATILATNGLSVIKPRRPSERDKRTTYPERRSFRDELREAIDIILDRKPKDLDEFIKLLEEQGYEIKRGKYISVKGMGQKNFLRLRSLGAGYREQDLEKIFAGEVERFASPERKGKGKFFGQAEKKMDMLLDIQDIIAKGKGPGYERWAKIHNIKQISQTLLFLKEHDIRDYDDLAARASDASKRFGEITTRQKELEAKLVQIAALKTHIINYSKTKDVYVAYRKYGYSKKFFEEHREALTLHKAAKDAFSKLDGKIPKIKELNAEYEKTLSEKKATYAEYRQAQKEMKEMQTAKYNVDQFLRADEHERKEKQKKRERSL